MPVDLAFSKACRSPSAGDTSGGATPSFTATAIADREKSRLEAVKSLPSFANRSRLGEVLTTTSNISPSETRLEIASDPAQLRTSVCFASFSKRAESSVTVSFTAFGATTFNSAANRGTLQIVNTVTRNTAQ